MSIERERDAFRKTLKNYTTMGLVVLMRSNDVDALKSRQYVSVDDVNHARMVFEECQLEFKKRLNIQ